MWENSWDSEFTQSFLVLYCVGEHQSEIFSLFQSCFVGEHQTEWDISLFQSFSVGEHQTEWNIQSFSVLFCGRISDRVKYSIFLSPVLWESIWHSEILSLFQSYSVGEHQTEWNTQMFSDLFYEIICERTWEIARYSPADVSVVACFKLCSVPTPWLCRQLLHVSDHNPQSLLLYVFDHNPQSLLLYVLDLYSCCCMFQTYIPVVAWFTPSLLLLHDSHLHSCCCMFDTYIPVAWFTPTFLLLHDSHLHSCCCMFDTYIPVVCFTPTFLLLHDSHLHSCCCMLHTFTPVVACFTPTFLLLLVSCLHSCCCIFQTCISVVAYFRLCSASQLLHVSHLHSCSCMFHTPEWRCKLAWKVGQNMQMFPSAGCI